MENPRWIDSGKLVFQETMRQPIVSAGKQISLGAPIERAMTKNSRDKTAQLGLGEFSLRIHPSNPNHHLWWNRGTWWLHATVHLHDNTKSRTRLGLKTKDIELARKKRDLFLKSKKLEVLG